jgi:deazaflavin-dependent oxidoreductase (nitroreductase family)
MAGSAARDRVIYPLQKRVVNPIVMLAHNLGIPPPGDALLETTGRRTGRPVRTPVCDGLDGDIFWLIAQRGRRADWVKNIQADPRVRVKVRTGSGVVWRAGAAHIVDEDDPRERQRLIAGGNLARRLCVGASAAMATDPLTVRVDLDTHLPSASAQPGGGCSEHESPVVTMQYVRPSLSTSSETLSGGARDEIPRRRRRFRGCRFRRLRRGRARPAVAPRPWPPWPPPRRGWAR